MSGFSKYLTFIILVGLIAVLISNLVPSAYETIAGVSKVAKIKVIGVLAFEDDIFGRTTSIESVLDNLATAENDPEISAILLDIDSPGGLPVASYELARKVSSIKKPVISIIRDTGTSGAYWVAAASDYIVASDLSIVGSIGVTSSYLEFSGLLDYYNVTYVRAVSGEQKDFGSPYKKLSQDEDARLNSMINTMFEFFLGDVKAKRNLTENQASFLSSGIVMLGREGLDYGLVDTVGGSLEVEEYLRSITSSNHISFVEYERSKSFLETLFSSAFSKLYPSLAGNFLPITLTSDQYIFK